MVAVGRCMSLQYGVVEFFAFLSKRIDVFAFRLFALDKTLEGKHGEPRARSPALSREVGYVLAGAEIHGDSKERSSFLGAADLRGAETAQCRGEVVWLNHKFRDLRYEITSVGDFQSS